MGRNKKQYIGAIEDERDAALIYDWHAIMSQGIRVIILTYKLVLSYRQKQISHTTVTNSLISLEHFNTLYKKQERL